MIDKAKEELKEQLRMEQVNVEFVSQEEFARLKANTPLWVVVDVP